jgi:hypothetical protein
MDGVLSYVTSSGLAMLQMALFCIVAMIFCKYPRPLGLLTSSAVRAMSQQVRGMGPADLDAERWPE